MTKQQGFSLLEMMITNVIGAILLMALVSLWTMTETRIRGGQTQSALTENLQELRLALGTGSGCGANLAGSYLSMTSPQGALVPKLSQFNSSGAEIMVVARPGIFSEGYEIREMRLKPVTQVDLSHVIAQVDITYGKPQGGVTSLRGIGLLAQVSGGKLQNCWVRKDPKTVAGEQMCQGITGGVLNEFDPITRSCGLTNGQWFTGNSAFKASCPPGTQLPEKATAGYLCGVKEPPGFVDPDVLNPRYSSDGRVIPDDSKAYTMKIDKKGNCACNYDTRIPTSTMSQFQCQIQCVVL